MKITMEQQATAISAVSYRNDLTDRPTSFFNRENEMKSLNLSIEYPK